MKKNQQATTERPVRDTAVTKDTTLAQLAEEYEAAGGFVAKKLGTAVHIMKQMTQPGIVNFLSFPASLVSTGTRGILKDLLKRKLFHYVFTTCGTLDHDFARVWKDYYHGSFSDSDAALYKQHTHRLGNVRIPMAHHGMIIEEKLQPMLKDIYREGKRELATYELVWELGRRLETEARKDESLIYWCYKNRIPMVIPGITDGTFGTQLLMFMQQHRDFRISVWKDEEMLLGNFFGKKMKTGALMLGGGISKHHTIWWNQFCGGLDYAVYITTAPEWDGSLSGARIREGISWGKVKEHARFVTLEGDVTVLLPLVAGPLL